MTKFKFKHPNQQHTESTWLSSVGPRMLMSSTTACPSLVLHRFFCYSLLQAVKNIFFFFLNSNFQWKLCKQRRVWERKDWKTFPLFLQYISAVIRRKILELTFHWPNMHNFAAYQLLESCSKTLWTKDFSFAARPVLAGCSSSPAALQLAQPHLPSSSRGGGLLQTRSQTPFPPGKGELQCSGCSQAGVKSEYR